MAQKPDPLSYIKKAELKSDVVGSYPTEIWKYSWIVEYWSIHEKTTIVYTDFGAVAEITVVGEDGNLHTTYTYNQDHTISEIVIQKKEGEVWVNDRRERIEYNEMGHPTSIITESWFNSEWMMSVGYQYTYTMSDEQIVGILGKLWSRDDQDWINSTRQSISFSQDLSVTESIMEVWENGAWKITNETGKKL